MKNETPKILKNSCTISFWLTKKYTLCVFFSQKKRRKQPCEKKCLKEQFGLAFQNLFGCLFVCLFVCLLSGHFQSKYLAATFGS